MQCVCVYIHCEWVVWVYPYVYKRGCERERVGAWVDKEIFRNNIEEVVKGAMEERDSTVLS